MFDYQVMEHLYQTYKIDDLTRRKNHSKTFSIYIDHCASLMECQLNFSFPALEGHLIPSPKEDMI
jgi:hypothetical protein